jgi:hypothetical protein
MRDIDVDDTDVYGVKEDYTGTSLGRVRIAISDGSEVWRLTGTTLAGIGIICNSTQVYLTKGQTPKAIEDIVKSTGAVTTRTFATESGNFARGVIDGTDLYLCGYWQNAGLWNPTVHKINTSAWTQTWKYTDDLTLAYLTNCVKDESGIYVLGAPGYTTNVVLLKLDLAGALVWKETVTGGYGALYAITQLGDYLFIGFHKAGIGTVQKRLKSTGELV